MKLSYGNDILSTTMILDLEIDGFKVYLYNDDRAVIELPTGERFLIHRDEISKRAHDTWVNIWREQKLEPAKTCENCENFRPKDDC